MPEAARHLDEISHSHAKLGFLAGTLAAGILGGLASYGLGAALAGMACVFPFGTIAAIAIGVVVGVLVIGPAGDFLQSAGEAIGSTYTYVTGVLTAIGSANVLINKRAAFRADARLIDFADCSDHPSPKHSPVIEGATTVWTNAMRAARNGDAVDCDAKISGGSANVLIGSPPFPVAVKRSQEISEDLRKYAGWFRMGAEIIGGAAAGVGKSLPCFLANVGIGVGVAVGANAAGLNLPIPSFDYGKRGGSAAGTWLGNTLQGRPVHVPTGAKIVPFEDDALLPGPLPFVWSRFYSSMDGRTGILGQGWVTPASLELVFEDGLLHFIGFQGRDLAYEDLAPGDKRYIVAEGFQIARSLGGHYYVSYPADGLIYAFGPRHTLQDGERLRLHQCNDLHDNTHEYLYSDDGLLRRISTSAGQHLHLHYGNPGGAGTRLVRLEQQIDHAEATDATGAADAMAPSQLPATPSNSPTAIPATITVVSYRYDTEGNLSEVIDRQGQLQRSFTYQNHLMVTQRFASGLLCYYEWDQTTPEGKVLYHRIEDPQAPSGGLETYTFTYGEPDATGHYEVHCTDHLGRHEHWQCNTHWLVTRYTNALGDTSEIDWNDQQRMTRHSLPGGGDWRFTYDSRGQLATVYDPLGRSATLRWEDRWGKLVQLIDWDGRRWQCTYNDTGDLTETTGPAGWSQSTVYNDAGLPVLSTDAQGGVKRLRWSERAELLEYTDCSNQSTRYTWDRWGHLQAVTDALGQATEFTHDPIGQLLAVRTADGASQGYQYDAAGRLIGASDPLSRAARFAYNARNQLSARRDAEDRPISLHYDAAHRLSALVNENGETFHFQYDAADRLTQETRVGGTQVAVEYDANGWPTAVTHHPGIGDELSPTPGQSTAGQTPEVPKWGDGTRAGTAPGGAQPQRTEFIRDAVGRLIDKRTPAHHYHYRYDALDQLLEAKKLAVQPDGSLKPLHTTRFEYDAVGNLIAETATDEATGHTHTLRHAHDQLGNRLQTTLPALPGQETTERALNYLHYGSGHLHQINFSQRSIQSDKKNQDGPDDQEAPATHQLICDIERDALHRETQRTQGKATTRYALDPLGRRTGAWSRSSSLTSAPFSANDTDWQRAILSAGTSEARPLNGLMRVDLPANNAIFGQRSRHDFRCNELKLNESN